MDFDIVPDNQLEKSEHFMQDIGISDSHNGSPGKDKKVPTFEIELSDRTAPKR